MLRTLTLAMVASLCLAPMAHAKKDKKKKDKNAPPPVGWHAEEGWAGECWFPPNFDEMGPGDRRMAWQETREQIMGQWSGNKGDGVQVREKVVMDMETVLLAKPERIQQVSADNLEQCKAFMAAGGTDAGPWVSWLTGQPAILTEGECPYAPLDYTLFDYLNITAKWQIPANVCKDDHIKIKATEGDFYRIEKGGPWINANGDPDQVAGGSLPCNHEGCFKGQLLMRYTPDNANPQIMAVGTFLEFRVPAHGKIEIMINDDDLMDNEFKVESGLEHHTGIEYSAVGG